ncbi:MAG: serpin family protein [Bdellovibrionaceae bacterium]|nr:serpin family protein [Pseudobdellovibrionaceae bacterium]
MFKTFPIFIGLSIIAGAASAQTSNVRFTANLYQQLKGAEGNLFFSPYSASQALRIAAEGAGGVTKKEFEAVLGAPPKELQAHAIEWNESNRFWIRKDLKLSADYQKNVREKLKADVVPLDFAAHPQKARETINDEVAKQTKDRIKDLIPKEKDLSGMVSILTNAVYFKAPWAQDFSPEATQELPFQTLDGKKTTAKMMHNLKSVPYGEDAKSQWLSLDYGSSQSARFTLILPRKGVDFRKFEASLDEASLQKILGNASTETVEYALPKFTFASDHQLTPALKSMGLKNAFTPGADFKAMFDPKASVPLYLSEVIQKAWIEVNEKGTEAAAATAVYAVGGAARPKPNKVLRADRPFLFVISGKTNGEDVILFMGRVLKP